MTITRRREPSRGTLGGGILTCGIVAIGLLGGCGQPAVAADRSPATQAAATRADRAGLIRVDGRDLQRVIDEAPPHSVILCDPNQQITRSVPFKIDKPLTMRGLNARLPDKLGSTPLVIVTAKGVTVSDFVLTGNGDTVSQDVRAPLLVIGAGDFRVENGQFFNCSKDGINIDGDVLGCDIVGGVVRDIVGRKVIRDTVSISGSSSKGGRLIRNVLVENIRCYESERRGCVEVSDGTDNITVRKVYAESSVYAIDVQDHDVASQINRNVVVEDVYALRCKHAIRTSNRPLGHANLTVRDITAKECTDPVQISNTDNLSLYNVRVIDHTGNGKHYAVYLKNCQGVSVRDVTVENTGHKGPAMLVEDCDHTLIDGFTLRGRNDNLGTGIAFRLTTDRAFSGLRISNVFAPEVTDAGIILEATGKKKGTLADYIIAGNLAKVQDRIQGPRASIVNNLP
jgi:hypothetical protein